MPDPNNPGELTLHADIAALEAELAQVLDLSHIPEQKRIELTELLRRIKAKAAAS